MTNYNSSELNIDIIHSKIREEAERIKAGHALPVQNEGRNNPVRRKINIFPHQKETGIWRAIKKVQYKFQQFTFYSFIYRFAVKFKAVIPKYKK